MTTYTSCFHDSLDQFHANRRSCNFQENFPVKGMLFFAFRVFLFHDERILVCNFRSSSCRNSNKEITLLFSRITSTFLFKGMTSKANEAETCILRYLLFLYQENSSVIEAQSLSSRMKNSSFRKRDT